MRISSIYIIIAERLSARLMIAHIYIYIYICLSRFCACAAHAQDNNNYNYLYVQWVAMVFLVYFPRRFGMQLPLVAKVLREASALMRISSILYIIIYI